MQPIIVSTTCAEEKDAVNLSRRVLEKRLAACVQISGPVTSLYWWNESIAQEKEYHLSMKTKLSLFADIAELLKKVHPYDVPEIIATRIDHISQDYRDWLTLELAQKNDE